ncbi:MAG: hypothetical protein HYT61_03625 [Candidatus Yanofskybacteria bacterium]|nr:hypothetical protein [Candidatus Yanofskybacteria bacterium]
MNFEIISKTADILVGITAVVSLWISIKAIRKADWNSALSTVPSLILRPLRIWVGVRHSEVEHGYGVMDAGSIIRADANHFEIVFSIEFDCFNSGRGSAFNISQPKATGMPIAEERYHKVPLYQTTEDESFRIKLQLIKNFREWYEMAEFAIPVCLEITYMNDQNTVFCRSIWKAEIRPFDKDGENLKVRDTRLLNRVGRIQYSAHSYAK